MGEINIIYVLLIIFAVAITVRNFIQMKTLNKERKFVDVYTKVLKQEEDAYNAVKEYVKEEQIEYLKEKAKVLLVYEMMIQNEDPMKVVNDIDFKPLFVKNNKYNKKLAERNCDIFVWISLMFAKARSLSMFDVIETLSAKINEYEEYLKDQLEYKMYRGVCSSLAEKNDEHSKFLIDLLNGEYEGLAYDKKLIGLYKRIASCYLIYMGDTVEEYYENDLHSFATTLVGKCLMTDLEIIDRYPPIEEETEELKDANKESKVEQEEPKE